MATNQIKDLTVHLPPGVVGDPLGPATCTETQLNANNCPAASQAGTSGSSVLLLGTVPLDVNGKIFNVVPHAGEPARFGIVLTPPIGDPIILQSPAKLRTDDFGLDTVLNGLPNTANGLPIYITALDITLFGTANGQPFMRNPTSCDAKTVSFDATSYANETAPTGTAPSFTPTNCDALPFNPQLSATLGAPGGTDALSHPTLVTTITQDETEAGLKQAQVLLPYETEANNNALSHTCLEADFDANADSCPANSQIGSAIAASPLQTDPLQGPAYLLTRGDKLGVGLDLQGALHLKLKGTFVFSNDARTGNLFEGLPDIPISNFQLTINGGENGLLNAKRDLCDAPVPPAVDPFAEYDFIGHNGATTHGTTNAQIVGCTPTAKVKLKRTGTENPVLKVKGKAGTRDLAQMKVKLPKGLSFASGPAFMSGTTAADEDGPLPESGIKHGIHRVRLAATGARRFKLRSSGGAFIESNRIKRGHRYHFPVKLKDANGNVTKINAVARAL